MSVPTHGKALRRGVLEKVIFHAWQVPPGPHQPVRFKLEYEALSTAVEPRCDAPPLWGVAPKHVSGIVLHHGQRGPGAKMALPIQRGETGAMTFVL
eukprot:CAMPEP_0119103680 /NCGR_PEP_ID=MMETSP1180-20130426/2073_1 /TAXON_ID=3052 ORGANISM="Chlamydomonas cf sp, Strain CCMP681" /NCGR_SAMPLE_ID=MMETSP1180 /ASSEMBLY_ACC=CAM_ASM_000741 /LENGTH=95 /DNA_ID=CAMNT_0007088249 /DNA_START=553 /DNA_END=841 /DNA_ORIENTATION=-